MKKSMIETEVRKIAEVVSLEILRKTTGAVDVNFFREHFFNQVSECLSVLDYEYPILSDNIPDKEVNRWSVFWFIDTEIDKKGSDLLVCSISLVANNEKVLVVNYFPDAKSFNCPAI